MNNNQTLPGVNLGSWLLLERWITPSLFEGTKARDEYTFCQQASEQELARLKHFRDTFITKEDFVWLAKQGIKAVRLPIGYWLFGNAAPYQATVSYVDKAFQWAKEANIQILLDLHGLPGSQNGIHHSGQAGRTRWHRDANNISLTLDVIRQMADRYGDHPALLGISLMNEPMLHIPKKILLDFYKKAYAIIRKRCGAQSWIVYSDGYLPARWRKVLPQSEFPGLYIDTHHYRVFMPLDKLLPARGNLWRTRRQLPGILGRMNRHHPVIVGEWSLALDHATPEQLKAYARLQIEAFQSTAAWFFWTYKTEESPEWNFRDCVERGLLPKSSITQ